MLRILCSIALALCVSQSLAAQQVNSGVGQTGVGDSFSEFTGTSWGIAGRGWFFNFGGVLPGGATPPFGDSAGGGGLGGGFGFGGNGFSGNFNFLAQQGSSRTIGGTSASLTQMSGATGYIFDGRLNPFVTEIIPVVGGGFGGGGGGGVGGAGGGGGAGGFGGGGFGGGPMLPMSPLRHRLNMIGGPAGLRQAVENSARARVSDDEEEEPATVSGPAGARVAGSSADRGAASVTEIRRQQAVVEAAGEAELAPLLAEAERLEASGDRRAAANAYSRVAAKVEGERREEIIRKMRQLRSK